MNTLDFEKTYTKYREFILDEVMAIDNLFKLYIHIYNKQVDMLEVLNVAPAFFMLAKKAFLENSISCLSKLYDNDTNTITIYKFLNFIQANVKWITFSVSRQKIQEVILSLHGLLQINDEQIKKLKTIRDSFLAHNDKAFAFCDPWEKTGLTIGQIHQLIGLPAQIVNEIGVLKSEPYVDPEAINAFDIDLVFQIINDYLEGLKDDENIKWILE